MPNKDGRGPVGGGGGGGRMNGPVSGAPQVECVCPKCGTKAKHDRGTPCVNTKCPKCGTAMTRA